MKPTQDKYPLFEANQVLTSHHLNQIFDYLDEQERLTRANLIGIGIECGLEMHPETEGNEKRIRITKGCGVSSAGYLLIEPEDVTLVSYQKYILPTEVEYPGFTYESGGTIVQYPLWEMFPAGQPNSVPLGKDKGFLVDKAVVLFLELKKEGLRNCSPNNCDDKGDMITATLRRLLIGKDDLAKIIAKANKLGTGYTATDIESSLLSRLNLPDLRLPRYNVPNTTPLSSNDVLAAFQAVFQNNKLAANTGKALSSAYKAFYPLLSDAYPLDPFADFGAKFGALDHVPASTSQVRFLQYYYDLFDDLLQAYEEFRWKGAGLMCACCPPEGLFPRHLMLGLVNPASVNSPGVYRHDFLSSPAIQGCEERTAEVLQLFKRLVEMVLRFTDNPTPPDFSNKEVARKFIPVRVTPTKLADVPLSQKAIPYYYLQNGTPPLFQLWNVEKTRRNRANQNLGFRSDEYDPKPPIFVTRPLEYDLEPYNFLRIEGHLGKNVKSVLSTLLALKNSHRLPVEIIALRTGEFDARMPVDLSKEKCRFEDLEALFDALRDEFISALGKTLASFYRRKVSKDVLLTDGFKSTLLSRFKADAVVEPSTFGALLETHFATLSKADSEKVFASKKVRGFNIKDAFLGESIVIQAAASYAEVLLDISNYLKNRTLSEFDLREFRDLFGQLEDLNNKYKKQIEGNSDEWNQIFDLIEALRYASQMEAFRSIGEEYRKRLIEVKKKQFLSDFLQKNPGIQHKAGVPIGGTFIIVYHDDPTPLRLQAPIRTALSSLSANFSVSGIEKERSETLTKAFERLQIKDENADLDPDIRMIINEMSRSIARPGFDRVKGIREKSVEKIIAETVNEFADGTVIADFYLPYICCSDCSPIQYIFPKDPFTFTTRIECTNPENEAKVVVSPVGGTEPYKIKINNEDFTTLKPDFLLAAGKYSFTLMDSEGTLTDVQQIEIPANLTLGEPNFDCTGDNNQYVAVINISGGIPPYSANIGSIINEKTFFASGLPGNTDIEIVITDSRKCSVKTSINHSCVSDLAFTAEVGCTSPKNLARVEIVTSGGVEPFEIQVDNEPFILLEGQLNLSPGNHALTVRDSSGATASQQITIPETVALTITEFICDNEKNSYQARIQVSGGTAPYISDTGKQVSDTEFITNPIPGGESITFQVFDSKKCKSAIVVEHTCEEECKLPCEGQSRKCAYRLWLQPPAKGSAYRSYNPLKEVKLRFNGIDFNLPQMSQISAEELNNDFEGAMAKTIGILNEEIQKALIQKFGDEGKNRLVLSYEPTKDDPFAVLWIEHFVCETFNIEFAFNQAKPSPAFALQFNYTNETDANGNVFDGTITTNIELNGKQTLVPAFDCRERNQCTGSEFVKLCTDNTLKPDFIIERSGDISFIFQSTTKNKKLMAWVWDVLNTPANEPYFQGEKVDAIIRKPTGVVRLTVINESGCFAFIDKEFQV
jgi:hypothetical protein